MRVLLVANFVEIVAEIGRVIQMIVIFAFFTRLCSINIGLAVYLKFCYEFLKLLVLSSVFTLF